MPGFTTVSFWLKRPPFSLPLRIRRMAMPSATMRFERSVHEERSSGSSSPYGSCMSSKSMAMSPGIALVRALAL